jgi:Tfp pilus assembly protein PilO
MKPKQFFLVLLGLMLVLVVAGGGGYYLALQQLHTRSQNLASEMAGQTAAAAQVASLTHLESEYKTEIVPILPLMDEALPTEKKQTEILAQLQTIATQVGLSIASVSMPSPVGLPTSTSQTVATGQVLALPISFQLSGTYQQLQTFTADVENLNRFTSITDLAISHPDKTKPIVYSISLNAYIKP